MEVTGALLGTSGNNSYKKLSASKSGIWANFRWSPYFKDTASNQSNLSIPG